MTKIELLELFTDYEELFYETLGDWSTKISSFELKEGSKSYHGWLFPVPRVHEDTIIKELN